MYLWIFLDFSVGHFLFLDFDGAEVISETTGNNTVSDKHNFLQKSY